MYVGGRATPGTVAEPTLPQIFALAKSAFPPSMAVIAEKLHF